MAVYQAKGVTPQWWTPDSERDEDEPLQLLIAPLTPSQVHHVMVDVSFSRDWPCGPKAVSAVLRWAVRDWSGAYDASGNPVAYDADTAADMLPASLQQEIATHAVTTAMMTETDRKNS